MGLNIDFTSISSNIHNVCTGDEISVGKYHLRVIETPGHTPGSLLFILDDEKIVFTGDTIFKGSVGPTSLPFGDKNKLFNSIKERILVLPNDYTIYPGHGDPSTKGAEKSSNPYLLSMTKESE